MFGFKKSFRYLVVPAMLTIGVLVFFQNCGEIHIQTLAPAPVLATAASVSQGVLPPPVNVDAPLRVVFLIDQSHSNKFSGCPTDLDGISPDPMGPACVESDGADSGMLRFAMVQMWLDYLKWINFGTTNSANIQVALVPFTGGMKQFSPPAGGYKFVTLDEGYIKLSELRQMQVDEPMYSGPKKMGTTSPLRPLQDVNTLLDGEMTYLSSQNILENAGFELVMITDGFLKPYAELLRRAQTLAGCPSDCNTNPGQQGCSPSGQLGWENGVDPYTYCNTSIPQAFAAAYGSISDNNPDQITAVLRAIANLPQVHAGGTLNVRLVQTAYTAPGANDKVNSVNDIVQRMNTLINFKNYQVTDLKAPFTIQPKKIAQLSYIVKRFYVIPLNSRINEFGKLVADSDGDGISDDDEQTLEWDPVNPYTAANGGKCNDGIFKQFGCEKKRTCDPLLDSDADGINQCEEFTLNSNELASDSDTDEVLDSFEALGLGLNPNQDETLKHSSGDTYSDHQHFAANVHVQIPLESVSSSMKVDFKVQAVGTTISRTASGSPVKMTNYLISVDNLPLVLTRATNFKIPAMQTMIKKSGVMQKVPLPESDYLGSTAHAAGVNQFIFVIKMTSVENPDAVYWLMQRRDVNFSGKDHDKIDLDLSEFHHLTFLK